MVQSGVIDRQPIRRILCLSHGNEDSPESYRKDFRQPWHFNASLLIRFKLNRRIIRY